jgi:OmpA-OmpF porin, OOP family
MRFMRNCTLFFFTFLFLGQILIAQGELPPNPKPGQCYIRCVTEDKWRDENKRVMVTPGYKKLEVVPAEYKTVEEQVLTRPATKRFEFVQAVFKKVVDTIVVVDPFQKITVVPVQLTSAFEEVITQPAFARFEWKSTIENCKSKDPRDCQVLCYVEYPEQKNTIPVKKIDVNTSYTTETKAGKTVTIIKEVMVSPPQIKEVEIPATFVTIKRQVLVRDETVREVEVDPQYVNESVRVLVEKGGMAVWEEIECRLTEPNPLPIFYELGSARLTAESRNIINERLYKLMVEKPLIRIEINSHTDSRESDAFNMELSQRRAQSVVDYLVSKGIKSSRLIAQGYGETRLKNHCTNGVNCSEAEHAVNRRTEFRVLAN